MYESQESNGLPSVSIVVATYKEAESLPLLVRRIEDACRQHEMRFELIVVDDNSGDGTEEVLRSIARPWVQLVVRRAQRDLSLSVAEGLKLARNEVLVVMDADLSHPPEKIPQMVRAVANGHDFVVGSRYIAGGSTDERWGRLRRLGSRAAAMMARPLTNVKDPMSGFFALPRETFARAEPLRPIGYKIGLELLTKCHPRKVCELPIHFTNRRFGRSKLSMRQKLRFCRHLWRLLRYKYAR